MSLTAMYEGKDQSREKHVLNHADDTEFDIFQHVNNWRD